MVRFQTHTNLPTNILKLFTTDTDSPVTFVNANLLNKIPCTNTREDILTRNPSVTNAQGHSSGSELNQHKIAHKKYHWVPCLYCKKSFTTKNSVNQHASTHGNKNKFSCSVCDFKPHSQYNLAQHKNGQHGRGVKAKCGKQLKWKSSLKWHGKKCENGKEM